MSTSPSVCQEREGITETYGMTIDKRKTMRNNVFLTMLLVIFSQGIFGQITLEHTYNVPFGKSFFVSNLGNDNYKYVLLDYYNDVFQLYDLNHTLYATVNLPVSLDSGVNTVAYITTSLFDCDSTNIEYTIMSPSSFNRPFFIYRTDNTLIWSKDSVQGPYCYGCNNGSVVVSPIYNTPLGAKLMLMSNGGTEYSVYSLCGSLPETVVEVFQENHYVQIYPNPSSGMVTFQVDMPSNIQIYELVILNANMQVISTTAVSGKSSVTMDNPSLNSGVYFYTLKSGNTIEQTGKFIISK